MPTTRRVRLDAHSGLSLTERLKTSSRPFNAEISIMSMGPCPDAPRRNRQCDDHSLHKTIS